MYEKLRMLVKPTEFVAMMALPFIGFIMGGVSFGWMLAIMLVYVGLQLTGWGAKQFQEVIDETKDNVNDIKEKVEDKVDEINNK